MKNDFQAQLDSYNTSIDSKIDNAIASYLQGVNIAAESTLQNNYTNMTIVGNKDAGVLWSSDNNKRFCTDATQNLAMDYFWLSGEAYNGEGYAAYWHKTVDAESKGRQRKRFWVDKNGFIKGRNIWKFWVYGGWSGSVWRNYAISTIESHSWSSHLALNKIDKRSDAVYVALRGNGAATNPHFGSAIYLYHEEQTATNENVGVYPLSETDGEYVADDREQTISVTGNDLVSLMSNAEWLFNDSNSVAMGSYPKASAGTGGPQDTIGVTLSGPFTSYKLSDFKYLDFYNKNSKNAEIKCGIAIATATGDGQVTVKGKCNYDGYIILYSNSAADKLWDGQRTSVTDTTSWKTTKNQITANVDWSKTITDVKKGDGIFILYLPSDTTVLGTMNITEIKQTTK